MQLVGRAIVNTFPASNQTDRKTGQKFVVRQLDSRT